VNNFLNTKAIKLLFRDLYSVKATEILVLYKLKIISSILKVIRQPRFVGLGRGWVGVGLDF